MKLVMTFEKNEYKVTFVKIIKHSFAKWVIHTHTSVIL